MKTRLTLPTCHRNEMSCTHNTHVSAQHVANVSEIAKSLFPGHVKGSFTQNCTEYPSKPRLSIQHVLSPVCPHVSLPRDPYASHTWLRPSSPFLSSSCTVLLASVWLLALDLLSSGLSYIKGSLRTHVSQRTYLVSRTLCPTSSRQHFLHSFACSSYLTSSP